MRKTPQINPNGEASTTKVILDTNYWICFKDYRHELFDKFVELVHENEIEVLFSYGNFVDLIKYRQQDQLSEMISSVVTKFVPPQEYKGDSYTLSTNPVDLIPESVVKLQTISDTQDFGDLKTLRYMFRISSWEGREGSTLSGVFHYETDGPQQRPKHTTASRAIEITFNCFYRCRPRKTGPAKAARLVRGVSANRLNLSEC